MTNEKKRQNFQKLINEYHFNLKLIRVNCSFLASGKFTKEEDKHFFKSIKHAVEKIETFLSIDYTE